MPMITVSTMYLNQHTRDGGGRSSSPHHKPLQIGGRAEMRQLLIISILSFVPYLRARSEEPISLVSVTLQGRISQVFVKDNLCYASRGGELLILDISEPSKPKLRGSIMVPGIIRDIYVSGHYAYVIENKGRLRIIDISDPDDPKRVGSYDVGDFPYAICVIDRIAYVVTLSASPVGGWLRMVNISNPSRPRLVGSYDFGIHAVDVQVAGSLAYVGTTDGLRIIDVSDPSSPKEVGSYRPEGVPLVADVYVVGDLAYIATALHPPEGKFEIIDVKDPSKPEKVGEMPVPKIVTEVSVSGGYAYLVVPGKKVSIVDVSDPSSPEEVGYLYSDVNDIQVSGGFVYLACLEQGMMVVDVSDPSGAKVIGVYRTGDEVHGVYVAGGYAYVAYGFSGLRVLDVTDPCSPEEVGFLRREREGRFDVGGKVESVWVRGGYAYLLEVGGGFSVVDVSDPLYPRRVWFGSLHEGYGGRYAQVRVVGNYAYVIGSPDGLTILDVSDPSSPRLISSYKSPTGNVPMLRNCAYPTGMIYSALYSDIFISGNFAYLVSKRGLEVLDVSDVFHPVRVGVYEPGDEMVNVFVSGRYAYLAGQVFPELLTFHVVDISDPSQPKQVGYLSKPRASLEPSLLRGLEVQGDYAYVRELGAPKDALWVIDVSDPSHPTEFGRFEFPGTDYTGSNNRQSLFMSDGYIYVANYSAGLYIFRSNLWAPTAVEEQETSEPRQVSLGGNYPNPFNRGTVIRFQVPDDGRVSLKVYDSLGREVRVLVEGRLGAGEHEVFWDGRDEGGRPVGSGVYLYRLEGKGWGKAKKMVLLR